MFSSLFGPKSKNPVEDVYDQYIEKMMLDPMYNQASNQYYQQMAHQAAMQQQQQQQQNIYGQNISLGGINLAPWDTYNTKPTFNHQTGCVLWTTSDEVTIQNVMGLGNVTEWGFTSAPKELTTDGKIKLQIWLNSIEEAKQIQGLLE